VDASEIKTGSPADSFAATRYELDKANFGTLLRSRRWWRVGHGGVKPPPRQALPENRSRQNGGFSLTKSKRSRRKSSSADHANPEAKINSIDGSEFTINTFEKQQPWTPTTSITCCGAKLRSTRRGKVRPAIAIDPASVDRAIDSS
jgi:SLT domain-containing protein